MKILEKIQKGMGQTAASLASLLKIALMSHRPTKRSGERHDTIIIMGNGPSLRDAMEHDMDVLTSYPRLAVNFSALTPDFRKLRPDYYILADIAFFMKEKTGNVPALWQELASVDWPMTLFLPATARRMAEVRALPPDVTVKYYNLTPAEGFRWLMHPIYDSGLAMPRPRNVLIPSIMSAMREGFRRIVLIGADHNWSKTLWRRAEEIFRNVRLHEVYENYAIAFRSYHNLKAYTDRRGIEILNATPGSFIDAFPRITLSQLRK